MPTLTSQHIQSNNFDTLENIIYTQKLKIKSLDIRPEKDLMLVTLNKGLILQSRISSFSILKKGNKAELLNYKLIGNGTGIHWPKLDEDLSLKGLLRDYLIKAIDSKHVETV